MTSGVKFIESSTEKCTMTALLVPFLSNMVRPNGLISYEIPVGWTPWSTSLLQVEVKNLFRCSLRLELP